jgi:hypothetical protein
MADRPTKITFAELRDMGVRGVLIYCADYQLRLWRERRRGASASVSALAGGEAGANGPRQQLMTLTPTNPRCKPQQ